MKPLVLLMAGVMGSCDATKPVLIASPPDRAALEAVVAECDRGTRRPDCNKARQVLARARRDDRLAFYRQGF